MLGGKSIILGPGTESLLEMMQKILYHFNCKFTNSENLLAEMPDKFSFEF